jgi:spore coat polysaccharide biosynthesis predicted glycosyltransferase SpsG
MIADDLSQLEMVGDLKLTLRCDAGEAIGMGHVKRCLGLATWLGTKPTFALLETPESVHQEIRSAGYATIDLKGTEHEQAEQLKRLAADAIVFDIANSRWRARPDLYATHVKAICGLGTPAAFIDGFKSDAVLDDKLAPLFDFCVRPYPGAGPELRGRWLTGIEYFMLSRSLLAVAAEARPVPDRVRRLLVTTGGSDVGALSPRIVQELSAADEPAFDIRLIVGPLVSGQVRADIATVVANSRHAIEVLDNRKDLNADMRWCDMAISTTGLTKYELALSGVPMILISPNSEHDMNQAYFRDFGAALDLGVADRLPVGAIGEACRRLALDRARRGDMAQRGRAILDGRGAVRLLGKIKGLVDARG